VVRHFVWVENLLGSIPSNPKFKVKFFLSKISY
jgi:hypothetical protein